MQSHTLHQSKHVPRDSCGAPKRATFVDEEPLISVRRGPTRPAHLGGAGGHPRGADK